MDYIKQAQSYYSKAPLIVLGSGASAAFGLSGMWALGQHLIANTDLNSLSNTEHDSWGKFKKALEEGIDLEAALHNVDMSETLTSRIIDATWTLINSEDAKAFSESLQNSSMFPLSNLLNHMFKTSNNILTIITTNYDKLAEYACDQGKIHHYSGFTYGGFRHLSSPTEITFPRKVNIWKVHGSLDWFESPSKEVVAITGTTNIPPNYTPQIVTPGVQKYQRTHLEPYRTIINNADQAINNAEAYLCIGYGFNDEHIQPKLMAKCLRFNTPITIITRTLSESTKRLIINGKAQSYLAIERGANDDQSRVYSSLADRPFEVEKNIWSLAGYISLIM